MCLSPLKVGTSRTSDRPITRAAIAREAAVTTAVRHPNLTTILASQVRGSESYLVLPYLEGVTLRQLFASAKQALSPATALWIARQVAEALLALHKSGHTILLVTHDLEVLAEVVRRAIAVYQARSCSTASPVRSSGKLTSWLRPS